MSAQIAASKAEADREAALDAIAALPDWDVASFDKDAPVLLWSAGNRVTHYISENFFGQHYVWCSPTFDASAVERGKTGYAQPPSSDPVSIYRDLFEGVRRNDAHHHLVERHKAKLQAVALDRHIAKQLTAGGAREVISYLENSTIKDWVPLVYVIPLAPVASRVLTVPRTERASWSPEYVIQDLLSTEFSVIEPMPCH